MYSPENIAEDAMETANQFYEFLTSFPSELREILEKTRKGNLRIEHKNYVDEIVLEKVNRAANRLVMGIVTVGIYLASAIVLFAYSFYKGPYGEAILVLSLIGFIFAIIFTVGLMVGNWWSNR